MDIKTIKQLLESGENQEIEFKESLQSTQEIAKAITAFANTVGGVLLLGIKDNGNIVGIKESDKTQQALSSVAQSISPAPLVSIEHHRIDGKSIVLAVVQRPSDQSYYTFHGAIYVRMGSTNRRLEGQTHLDFLRDRHILSFDESYDRLATLEDLDPQKILAYLKSRKNEDYLNTHRIEDFLTSHQLAEFKHDIRIKNATVLLFAKNPMHFHPQAELKLAQFSGIEPVEILAHRLIQDDPMVLIEQALYFVKSHLSRRISITGEAKREEAYDYPLSVIRESIVNAVSHRDYFSRDAIQVYLFDDRVEITSPGSLPNGLTRDLFGTISVRRNPIIYRVLRDMGYIEGLGSGIPRMKNEMRKAGLTDPEFLISEAFFRITLRRTKGLKKAVENAKDLNDRQKKALHYLSTHPSIKTKTYALINHVSYNSAVNDIRELLEYGYLKKVGSYRGAYYTLPH